MVCRGICKRYKAKREEHGHYQIGNKRCQVCEIFIKWEGRACPCCGYNLRTKPRKGTIKDRMVVVKQEREKMLAYLKEHDPELYDQYTSKVKKLKKGEDRLRY